MLVTKLRIKNSIEAGTLPPDWNKRRKEGEIFCALYGFGNLVAFESDCIETECGRWYHNEYHQDDYSFDEIRDVYIRERYAVEAYGARGRMYTTHEDNCIRYNGEYYHEDYLSENNMVRLHNDEICRYDDARYVQEEDNYYHWEDCHYWESDGEYHLEEEDEGKLFNYHSNVEKKTFYYDDKENEKQIFGIGFEIEKSEMPSFDFDKHDLYKTTSAVIEEDGSVPDGFELVTPVYNLLSAKTDERIKPLERYCNVAGVENAGGHINFSMQGKCDEELLDLCRGFLPLIYAMHKKRLENTYCNGKTIKALKEDGAKYQSVRLRGNYIEFRIFSSVKNFDCLKFRLEFMRILAQNIGANFGRVLIMAVDFNHPLNKLLRSVYNTRKKFNRLIMDAYELDKKLVIGRLQETSLQNALNRLKANFDKAEAEGIAPSVEETE